MNINSFKLGDIGTLSKINLTKSEAIAVCSKGGNKARKILITKLIQNLLDIPEIENAVGEKRMFSKLNIKLNSTPIQLFNKNLKNEE